MPLFVKTRLSLTNHFHLRILMLIIVTTAYMLVTMKKTTTRRQAKSWLQPLRNALLLLKQPEINCIDGHPVCYVASINRYARIDECILGTAELIAQLFPSCDLSNLTAVADTLSLQQTCSNDAVDAALTTLKLIEDMLLWKNVKDIKSTQIREEIRFALQQKDRFMGACA